MGVREWECVCNCVYSRICNSIRSCIHNCICIYNCNCTCTYMYKHARTPPAHISGGLRFTRGYGEQRIQRQEQTRESAQCTCIVDRQCIAHHCACPCLYKWHTDTPGIYILKFTLQCSRHQGVHCHDSCNISHTCM